VIDAVSLVEASLFVLAALAAAYLVRPALTARPAPSADPRAGLEASRASVLRALHDLDLDWATGKLSDADYAAQRASLEGEAAAIGRRLRGGETDR
jgi:hypothetical protein